MPTPVRPLVSSIMDQQVALGFRRPLLYPEGAGGENRNFLGVSTRNATLDHLVGALSNACGNAARCDVALNPPVLSDAGLLVYKEVVVSILVVLHDQDASSDSCESLCALRKQLVLPH